MSHNQQLPTTTMMSAGAATIPAGSWTPPPFSPPVTGKRFNPVTYKTKMCNNPETCRFGLLCDFAHFPEEMVTEAQNYERGLTTRRALNNHKSQLIAFKVQEMYGAQQHPMMMTPEEEEEEDAYQYQQDQPYAQEQQIQIGGGGETPATTMPDEDEAASEWPAPGCDDEFMQPPQTTPEPQPLACAVPACCDCPRCRWAEADCWCPECVDRYNQEWEWYIGKGVPSGTVRPLCNQSLTYIRAELQRGTD